VTRLVNTSGGHSAGGEGMEKDYVRTVKHTPEAQRLFRRSQIIYADPMDLTKMLNIPREPRCSAESPPRRGGFMTGDIPAGSGKVHCVCVLEPVSTACGRGWQSLDDV